MKRTAMKRGKGIKRQSESNSRPWENLKLREAYRVAHGYDWVWPLIVESGHKKEMLPHIRPQTGHRWDTPADQLHHVFHSGKERHDLHGNLIALCDLVHKLDSTRWQNEFRIACLYAKLKHGEWNLAELNIAAGANRPDAQPVLSWLETHRSGLDYFERLRFELIRTIEKGV